MYKDNLEKNNFLAENKNCFHSRNLVSLFDLEKGNENFSVLFNHLKNCKICQKEFKNLESYNLALKNEIPRPQLDQDERKSLNSEIHELFRVFQLDNEVVIKNSLLDKLEKLNSSRKEMIEHLFSPQKVALYCFCAVIVYGINYFLS